jgi:ATP-dependent HslUV protease ATP-binding subunit HslU
VQELDKFIIGQGQAKRCVAIALRNRWRRQQSEPDMQKEIIPNNIILIGPTGVGKTEIARRLSRLAGAPFIKVEASKFTEVGYVGRDVESMVRELMGYAVNQVRQQMLDEVAPKAYEMAVNRVLDILLPQTAMSKLSKLGKEEQDRAKRSRQKMLTKLNNGLLEDREIEFKHEEASASLEILTPQNIEFGDFDINEMMASIFPGSTKQRRSRMTVNDALEFFTEQEANRLVSKDKVVEAARNAVVNNGIIFIDEIDKIATAERGNGIDVSRSGVQRDLLPIVEGSVVPTKYGPVDTSHILFIASGAFHTAKPSDLIPELQGRFPIRVELNSLSQDDFEKILCEPQNALTKQYKALFAAEGCTLVFSKEAVREIARFAALANEKMEDIGARRLHTIMNALLDEYLFRLPDPKLKKVSVSGKQVADKLAKVIESEDLSRFIL